MVRFQWLHFLSAAETILSLGNLQVYVNDIRDEHGGPASSSWFNSGAKAKDKVFIGSLFALIAGNLHRKNPAEGEFFQNQAV